MKPQNPRRWTVMILTGALLGYSIYDAAALARGAPERSVTTVFEVAAPRARVWQALSFDRAPSAPLPAWLSALHAPERYAFSEQGAGALRFVDYGVPVDGDDADRPRGRIVYRVEKWEPERAATFACTRNETRIGKWVDLIETRVELEDAAAVSDSSASTDSDVARTRVVLTTRYRRKLGPAAYFVPLMDNAVSAMHDMLAGEIREGAR